MKKSARFDKGDFTVTAAFMPFKLKPLMMKHTFLLLLAVSLLVSCKEETEIDEEYVITKFQENADKINSLEYKIRRIDTFARGGTVWNNTGVALIERDSKDEVFGFSFYGKRDDVSEGYLYDSGHGFKISREDKAYEINGGHYGLLGSPGGQMVGSNLFSLDSVYKSVSLTEDEKSYILKYQYEDDTVYNVTDIEKTIVLTKDNFFPVKVKRTSVQLGNRSASQTEISDIRINEGVENSIDEYKSELQNFTVIQPEERQPNKLLRKELPDISLPDLFDQNNMVALKSNRLTLIDFWEVWCGPCIASFPKVENLKNKYSEELNVIGIVSDDKENAIRLINEKGTTFLNLVGNDLLKKTFSVNSWPRYFLVDKDGIVQKEYFGFSDQIENDIKEMI